MTEDGACAMLGNLQEESGFKVNNLEDTANTRLNMTDEQYTQAVDNGTYSGFVHDGAGYGLFQVTWYMRKQYYLDFVRSRGKSIGDLDVQIDYMLWELKNMYPAVWKMLTSGSSLYDCTKELLYKWENPREKEENLKRRYSYAQSWRNEFGKKVVTTKMTQQEAIQAVLNCARNEIGYHEKTSNSNLDSKSANSGSGNYTKYAKDLDAVTNFYNGAKNGYAWCDIFVDWLFYKLFGADTAMKMLCQPAKSAGAGCLYSAQYYKQAGRFFSQPQPGDQIFFSYAPGEYSHTGIVESVSGSTVNTIEGNTSDQVARRSYPVSGSSIVGYGRPKWEFATGISAPVSVPDTSPATQAPQSDSVLRVGSVGSAVRDMQTKLQSLGYNLGRYGADGEFGGDTLKAVQQFQKDHGLAADGEAGTQTLAAIDKAIQAKSAPVKTEQKFEVGDMVQFKGTRCYQKVAGLTGSACKPGRALVIGVNETAKHPYRLCKINGYGSTVFGWVDREFVQAVVT